MKNFMQYSPSLLISDAAEATDPKCTAEHMAKSEAPIAKTIDVEVKNVFDCMG